MNNYIKVVYYEQLNKQQVYENVYKLSRTQSISVRGTLVKRTKPVLLVVLSTRI